MHEFETEVRFQPLIAACLLKHELKNNSYLTTKVKVKDS